MQLSLEQSKGLLLGNSLRSTLGPLLTSPWTCSSHSMFLPSINVVNFKNITIKSLCSKKYETSQNHQLNWFPRCFHTYSLQQQHFHDVCITSPFLFHFLLCERLVFRLLSLYILMKRTSSSKRKMNMHMVKTCFWVAGERGLQLLDIT